MTPSSRIYFFERHESHLFQTGQIRSDLVSFPNPAFIPQINSSELSPIRVHCLDLIGKAERLEGLSGHS